MLKLTDAETDPHFSGGCADRDRAPRRFPRSGRGHPARLRRSDRSGHRSSAIAQAQRLYFDPPENDRTPSRARWDRDAPRFEKVSKQAAG